MNVKEYVDELAKVVEHVLEKKVTVVKMSKVDTDSYGICVERDKDVEMTFNVTPLYEHKICVMEAVCIILETCMNIELEEAKHIDWIKDFDNIKDRLYFKVVNKSANSNYMEKYVCNSHLDLLKVYCIMAKVKNGVHSIEIKKEYLDAWGITEQTLMELAESNSKKLLPCAIVNYTDCKKMVEQKDLRCLPTDLKYNRVNGVDKDSKWILSNKYMFEGASSMFYKDILRDFAKTYESDILIVPTSVHEVVIVPISEVSDINEIRVLQKDNKENTPVEQFLSDNLYIYSREREQIEFLE